MREFVDTEIIPFVDEWELAQEIPAATYGRAAAVGMLAAVVGWPEDVEGLPPRPPGFDVFFMVIATDELCRCASGGVVWGLVGGFGIGMPAIVHFGTPEQKQRIALPCIKGEKRIALCVSEPQAGSDVAGLTTTAEDKGDHYLVNGLKKWITCGMYADFFTVAVQTNPGAGMGGVQLLLLERTMPGISTRAMDCMGVKGSGTAFIEFDDVKVPKENYIGDVSCLLRNFVTERIGLAIQACRFARVCVEESILYVKRRKAFGMKLVEQPVVRYKIAEMARQVEVTQAYIESLVWRVVVMERAGEDWFNGVLRAGAEAAIAKVQATKTFEKCAKGAAHLQGGNAYVKGNKIESLYRHVLSLSIPGGSEDVMIDYAARLSFGEKSRL